MKPKDLLEHLEKGDRTMEHLQATGKIDQMHEVASMNSAFDQAMRSGQLWSSQAIAGNQLGGQVRW